MRISLRAWVFLPLLFAGCGVTREDTILHSRQNYLAAKASCQAAYPTALVAQSDCRTDAANRFIRPYYRYPDLMTWVQTKRRLLAARVDAGKMTKAAFDRQVAQAEREVAREETRRNDAEGSENGNAPNLR
ncbi:MAG: hypothetical protein EXR07_21575 [Acetobacteraceae bacterium]|nr:hypothetical protein [Acetobacteraceae bacterium]